jgi:hypothetical protein
MSFTYVLRTSQANILPATYPITITAFQEGLPQFTTSLQVQVTAVAVVGDTVRTIAELLTVIWADGQMDKQLTPQDARDTIISLALQRGDFSRLPRSTAGLPSGRAYVDPVSGQVSVNI